MATAEIYPTDNGYMVCVLNKDGSVDFGFTIQGSAVKFDDTVKALKRMRIKVLLLSRNVEYYDLVRQDFIDKGFTVENL